MLDNLICKGIFNCLGSALCIVQSSSVTWAHARQIRAKTGNMTYGEPMPMGAKFYLLCTESASPVSPAALSTPQAHSLPEWYDCRLTIGSIEDNIIKVSRHGNLSKVCLLFKSRSMLCLSIDWAPANIQLRHKFKHVTSSSVSEFKTTDVEAGHAYKTLKGGIYSSSPLSTRKSGEMWRHKKEGEEGALERKEALLLAVKSQAKLLSFVTFFLRFEAHVSGVSQVKWEEGYPRLALSRREAPLPTWLHLKMPHWVPVLALGRGSTHRNNLAQLADL